MIRKVIRQTVLMLALILVLAAGAASGEVYIDQEKPEDWESRDLLRIWALYALDCDSFVVECGGETMLIDGGNRPKEADLTAFLKEHGWQHLNIIYNSHPHDDHIEAQYNALMHGNITADVFISPFQEDYRANDRLEFHKKTMKVLTEKGIPFRQLLDKEELTLGGAKMVQYRYGKETKKPGGGSMTMNDLSGVLRICFGDASILLTADIGGTIQEMMAKEYGAEVLKSDILKAPHHGKNAVNAELLRTVDPKLVLVTGKVARTKACVNQIKKAGIPCKLTSYGTILMETDGKDWYVNQEDKWGELEKQRKKLEKQQKKKK